MKRSFALFVLLLNAIIVFSQSDHSLIKAKKELLQIKESMVKGEYEKTEEYKIRFAKLQKDYDAIIAKDYYCSIPIRFSSYDADNEILKITVLNKNVTKNENIVIDELFLRVPPNEAKALKENKNDVIAKGKFWIEPNSHVFLDGQLEIYYKSKKYKTNPSGNKTRVLKERIIDYNPGKYSWYLGDTNHKFCFADDKSVLIYSLNNLEKEIEYNNLKFPCTLSQDGKYLAARNNFGTAIINLNSDRVITQIKQELFDMQFSPDMQWLASKNSNGVTIWNINIGSKHKFLQHDKIEKYSFSNKGKYLITSGEWNAMGTGNYVLIWDPISGKKLNYIENGGEIVLFPNNDELIAILHDKAKPNIYNLTNSNLIKKLTINNYFAGDLFSFSIKGDKLIIDDPLSGSYLFDTKNFNLIKDLGKISGPFSFITNDLMVCKEPFKGIGSKLGLITYNLENWEILRKISYNNPERLYFNKNDNVLLIDTNDNKIVLLKITLLPAE